MQILFCWIIRKYRIMAKPQNETEYLDRISDDRKVNLQLGKNLHKARMSARTPGGGPVSFEWLAKVTAMHHGSIRRFEKGESGMTVASLVRLKDALRCSWGDLLEGCASTIVEERRRHFKF